MNGKLFDIFDAMFYNAKEKLSSIVKVLTVLDMIAAFIAGIVVATIFKSFWLFLLISIIGSVSIWIGSLLIIALLDMMTEISQIKASVYKDENKPLIANEYKTATSQTTFSNYWTCDKCNAENAKDALYCENCGAKKNNW